MRSISSDHHKQGWILTEWVRIPWRLVKRAGLRCWRPALGVSIQRRGVFVRAGEGWSLRAKTNRGLTLTASFLAGSNALVSANFWLRLMGGILKKGMMQYQKIKFWILDLSSEALRFWIKGLSQSFLTDYKEKEIRSNKRKTSNQIPVMQSTTVDQSCVTVPQLVIIPADSMKSFDHSKSCGSVLLRISLAMEARTTMAWWCETLLFEDDPPLSFLSFLWRCKNYRVFIHHISNLAIQASLFLSFVPCLSYHRVSTCPKLHSSHHLQTKLQIFLILLHWRLWLKELVGCLSQLRLRFLFSVLALMSRPLEKFALRTVYLKFWTPHTEPLLTDLIDWTIWAAVLTYGYFALIMCCAWLDSMICE